MLFLYIIFTPLFYFAQQQVIDSLKQKAFIEKNDSLKAFYYNKVGKEYWYINTDSSIAYTNKALKISELKKINGILPYCYNNFGVIEYLKGNYSKALTIFFKGLPYSKGNYITNGLLLNNIGMSYHELKDLGKAEEYYKKTLEIKRVSKDSARMANTYNNIGSIYNSLQKPDIAKLYFDTTLQIAKKFEDFYSEADALGNIANYYYKKRNYPLAEEYCRKAYEIKVKLQDDYGSATSASDLSAILMEQKKTNDALKILQEGEKIALQHNFIDLLLPIYRNYSQVFEMKGDYKTSIYYLNKAFEIKDTILMEGKIREAAIKEKEYNFNLVQIKDSLENENQKIQTKLLHDKEIYKQKTYSYVGIAGFTIMLIVSLIVFKAFQEKKKSNIIISNQKLEVEKQKHIIEEHQKEILDSIHYAKRIQYTLLAHEDFMNENIPNNFILFKPKDIVSGDFYWATKHGDKFYLAVCDSTGHGVPGAFMSLLNIGFLSEAINEKNILEPHKVLNFVRDRLINSISKEGQKDGFDGILICIDKNNSQISYAAANNAPILISNHEIIELEKDRMPVGKGERTEEFKLHTLSLKPNDTLYLYTDGYADQFGGPKGKKFKYKALNELLLSISSDNMISQKEKLNYTIENWKGDLEQVDDICVVGIKF